MKQDLKTIARRALLALALSGPVAVLAQPAPPVSAPPASAYSAGVATDWFQLALLLSQQTPGFSPPVTARALGYLGLTLYESVVPGMPQHISLAGQLNELASLPWAQPDEPLHWPSVANAALATMTRMMFSNASAENKARIDLLERSLPLKYSPDFDPAAVTPDVTIRSETFGKLMAMAIMTWARTDGGHEAWGPLRRNQSTYVPPSGAGQWSATPPSFSPPLLPRWGPVTYVQLVIDSNWVPSLMHTPPFPEYPSGHSVQSSAAAAVLGAIFGANTGFTDNTHNDRGWGPRTFTSFQAAADEAALSRLYAGIHFRTGVLGGQVQGACVASKVLGLKFHGTAGPYFEEKIK